MDKNDRLKAAVAFRLKAISALVQARGALMRATGLNGFEEIERAAYAVRDALEMLERAKADEESAKKETLAVP